MRSKFTRDEDGVLVVGPGRHYEEPEEAVKTWWAGELRLGCNARVVGDWSSGPCGKKPKHDPDKNGRPTKCGIHCKTAVEKRRAKSKAKLDASMAHIKRQNAIWRLNRELPEIIRAIADGHNDPRSLCTDWLHRRTCVEQNETKT